MGRFSIRRHALRPMMAGLMMAQVVGTLFVWQSNLRLQQQVAAVEAAGWLAVPAGPAAAGLGSLTAAMGGGLFFTLTVGAGLALATWAALYAWCWVLGRRRMVFGGLAILWLSGLAALNSRGFALWPSLFGVGVPLVTALAALQPTATSPVGPPRRWWVAPLVMVLLAGLWVGRLDGEAFITVRDQLLLNNRIGRQVNDFYYRYTLYAAEAFKAPAQKSWLTWRPAPQTPRVVGAPTIRVLARADLLAVEQGPVDVTLNWPDARHVVIVVGGQSIEVQRAAFMADPGRWLRTLSDATDRYAPFRRLTFAALLVGFPGLLFLVVHGTIGRLVRLGGVPGAAPWSAGGGCLVLGVLLFIPVLAGRAAPMEADALAAALGSGQWRSRVAALRQAEARGLDITGFDAYPDLLRSDRVVERYWLARALAHGRDGSAHNDLLTLIRDPHPNVVCQAYYALGRRGDRAAIAPILSQMVGSDHWYTQWYGYRALKELGWHQNRSPSAR